MIRGTLAALVVVLACHTVLAQTCVPAPFRIISWYPAEGHALDIVSGNNGGINGTVTFAPGMVGQAFRFNGNQNDGVNLTDVAAFNFAPASSFTIAAWVNVANLTVASGNDALTIVSLNYRCNLPTPATQMLAVQAGTSRAFFLVRDANGQQATVFSNGSIPANTWVHVVGVRDGNCSPRRLRLYVNGSLAATVTDPTNASLGNTGTNTVPDYIGRRPSCTTNNPFNGRIDEVTIIDRALTACEISAIYNAGSAGQCSPNPCVASACGAGSASGSARKRTGK